MSSPGLEILFSSVQRDVRAPGDCIVCALHWVLVTNGYKCFGKGEQASSRSQQKSELLPPGWNESQELYLLHYCHGANNFILKIVRADSALLVHLMREGDERTTSLNLHIPDYTTSDWGSYNSAFTNVERLEQTIKHQLLEDFKKGVSATTSQTPAHTENRNQPHYEDDPLRVPPRHSRQPPPPHWADPRNPMSVGRGDLDPFHQGGGMVMDPFRGRGRFPPGFNPSAGMPGFLPRGAVPPGARFDPFGPPGGPSGRRPGPDPDHARRPDFDDDMYM